MTIPEIIMAGCALTTMLGLGGAYIFNLAPKIDAHDKILDQHSEQHTRHFEREDNFANNMAAVTATLQERDRYYELGRIDIERRINRLEKQSNGNG